MLGITSFDLATEELCERLSHLSLLLRYDLAARQVRLHDVVRAYLVQELGERLGPTHSTFLDAYGVTRWSELPEDEPYLWRHLAHHLVEAGRTADLARTVTDPGYLARKTLLLDAAAVEADLESAASAMPEETAVALLRRHVRNAAHLLNRGANVDDILMTLFSRIAFVQGLETVAEEAKRLLAAPRIVPRHTLPDMPDPALIRTLGGHTGPVTGCAISADGRTVVSASEDGTLKVWDLDSGHERRTLAGHTAGVSGCAISADGSTVVSASGDRTLKVWDLASGATLCSLDLDGALRSCALSGDGRNIVVAGDAGVYFLQLVR